MKPRRPLGLIVVFCPHVQAERGRPGAAALRRLDGDAEVQPHEAPPAFTGHACRGKMTRRVFQRHLKIHLIPWLRPNVK